MADLVAALLLGVLQRILLFVCGADGKRLELRGDGETVTVGIDGSVFLKMPRYAGLKGTMCRLAGDAVMERVRIVHSKRKPRLSTQSTDTMVRMCSTDLYAYSNHTEFNFGTASNPEMPSVGSSSGHITGHHIKTKQFWSSCHIKSHHQVH